MVTKLNNNTISFKGQEFFIGLDVHKKHWLVTIRSSKMELKTFRMEAQPKSLYVYLTKNYPNGIYHSVYEAGFSGFWIDREFKKLGINNIVISAPDVPTTNKEKLTKTDKVDSRKLARELENNNLTAIYVPTEYMFELRSFCRLRRLISKDVTRIKNRIKSYIYLNGYHYYKGLELKHWSKKFIKSISELCDDSPAGSYLEMNLESLESQRLQLLKTTKMMRYYCYSNKMHSNIITKLMSIPGVGFITAVNLYVEIIDINRFSSLDKLCSFVGFVPKSHSSGDKENKSRITPRRNCNLKYSLIEASWIAVRKDPALFQAYTEFSKKMKNSKAIIKIAKKLLNRIRFVWKNDTFYKYSTV